MNRRLCSKLRTPEQVCLQSFSTKGDQSRWHRFAEDEGTCRRALWKARIPLRWKSEPPLLRGPSQGQKHPRAEPAYSPRRSHPRRKECAAITGPHTGPVTCMSANIHSGHLTRRSIPQPAECQDGHAQFERFKAKQPSEARMRRSALKLCTSAFNRRNRQRGDCFAFQKRPTAGEKSGSSLAASAVIFNGAVGRKGCCGSGKRHTLFPAQVQALQPNVLVHQAQGKLAGNSFFEKRHRGTLRRGRRSGPCSTCITSINCSPGTPAAG